MKDYSLIIFDMDGTLYPVNETIDRAYPEAAVHLAAKKTGTSFEEAKQKFFAQKEELSRILNGRPTNTLTLLYFYDVTIPEFEAEVDSRLDVESLLRPDERVVTAISRIARHYPLALYTTNNGKTARRILRALKLDSFFSDENSFTLSSADELAGSNRDAIRYIKPGSDGFLAILEKFNAKPERTLMVGDSEVSDIQPAKSLGIETYHIRTRDDLYSLPDWLGL